tara:strand:- start:40 stop:219 length:180 start_codon:yes stop_codon:yes gene_type:complete
MVKVRAKQEVAELKGNKGKPSKRSFALQADQTYLFTSEAIFTVSTSSIESLMTSLVGRQ